VIDAMTLLDVEELTRYWIEHPPVHLMVGAYLGLGKRRQRHPASSLEPQTPTSGPKPGVAELLLQLGPAFTGNDVHAGLKPVVLNIDELRQKAGAVG
jgi:hypothetical protein